MGAPAVKIIGIKCKIKLQQPQDCGFISWDFLHAAMARQKKKPFEDRVRPCIPHRGWVHYSTCQRCRNSLWEIEIEGTPAKATYHDHNKKKVELCLEGTGEIVSYPLR